MQILILALLNQFKIYKEHHRVKVKDRIAVTVHTRSHQVF